MISSAESTRVVAERWVGSPAAWLAQSSRNRCTQSESLDAQIAPMVEDWKLKSVAEGEAAAMGIMAVALINAGWTAERVAAELVSGSTAAAEKFKSNEPQTQKQNAVTKEERAAAAARTQDRKRRRQRQQEKKKRLRAMEEEEERNDEEFWFRASWAVVESAAMEKAMVWRQERQYVSAWRRLREVVRTMVRGGDKGEVGGVAASATEKPTTSAREAVAVEQNPLYEAETGTTMAVESVAASVASVVAVGREKSEKVEDTGVSGSVRTSEPVENVSGDRQKEMVESAVESAAECAESVVASVTPVSAKENRVSRLKQY